MKQKPDSVDDKQLAICKQRGHNHTGLRAKWSQCKWCGMWLREVITVQESRKAPPENEQDESIRLDRDLRLMAEQTKKLAEESRKRLNKSSS
jgi:hypothetical protein